MNKENFKKQVLAPVLSGLFTFFFIPSCGTTTGNPATVEVSFSEITTRAFFRALDELEAAATITQMKLCFKNIRFKMMDDDTDKPEDSGNLNFDLGLVTLSTDGGILTSLNVPIQNYKRVEFDLDNHCSSGKSLEVTKSNGRTVSSDEAITLKLDGDFSLQSYSESLSLDISTIARSLTSVSEASEIKSKCSTNKGSGRASRKPKKKAE